VDGMVRAMQEWWLAQQPPPEPEPNAGDPNEPPPPSNAPLMLTLPPAWTPLWAAMYEAALTGASPDEFLAKRDRPAVPDRLTALRDEGYGFGRGIPAPEDVDGEPGDSTGEA